MSQHLFLAVYLYPAHISFENMLHWVYSNQSIELEATRMNKTIRTIINVLPIFLVPLILERQKFKKHPEVQKTVATSKTVAKQTGHAAKHVKTRVVHHKDQLKTHIKAKKVRHDYKKAVKQAEAEQRAMHPDNVHARGDKLAKQNSKNVNKLDKKLQKAIDKRHKAEEKAQAHRQKAMKKDMTRMQKYSKQVGFVPGTVDPEVEAHGEKLAKRNKKEISKMDKKLQKAIQKRHKVEEKVREKRQKVMKKQLHAIQKHDAKHEQASSTQLKHDAQRIKTLSDRHDTKDATYRNDQIHNQSPDL